MAKNERLLCKINKSVHIGVHGPKLDIVTGIDTQRGIVHILKNRIKMCRNDLLQRENDRN